MNSNKIPGTLIRKPHIVGYLRSGAPLWSHGGAADEDPIERLEARNAELLAELEKIDQDAGTEARSEDQTKRWTEIEAELDKNKGQLDELRSAAKDRETRKAKLKDSRARWGSVKTKIDADDSDLYDVDIRSAFAPAEAVHADLASRAMKIVGDKKVQRHLEPSQVEHLERVFRTKNGDLDGQLLSAYAIATSNPAYRSAFQKATGSLHPVFEGEEGRAVSEVQALQRAMSVGTQAAGGFAVPVIIDPTIIMTAQGTENDILRLARVETITNDQWRGLTSAGVTWKFDAEAAPANDNSPTIARPAVPTYRADGFIPYSIEIGQDWPGFAEAMSMMLGEGYDELLADKLTNGTGANTPTGIIPRLLASGVGVNMASATAGTIAAADLYRLWGRLPQRHRRKDSTAWMSSTDVQSAVRQLGTIDPNFTVNIGDSAIPSLMGKDYFMNDYMPAPAVGTAAGAELVVGNWKGYLVAQRAGMNIEFIPMLFDPTNNRPTGQRGWFAYARVGADVVDPTAFQLMVNKTS